MSTFNMKQIVLRVLPPILGMGVLIAIWGLISFSSTNNFPSPKETLFQAIQVFSDPFYSNGPNDQGVGWNILSSLKRVALGFGLAAIVGIPFGFMIGRFEFLSNMFNPLISLLRPVSPLAWLPIGLLVFKGANPAAIWTIFICSIFVQRSCCHEAISFCGSACIPGGGCPCLCIGAASRAPGGGTC